jgi:predicted protein tyrosine phosphatase
MDAVSSYARQATNYAHFFGSRAVSLGKKYMKRGNSAFSTPRVPHTTPDKAPTAYQNAKNTIKALFMAPTCILDSTTVKMYVGSALNTASESTFTNEHVTHVLNCAGDDDVLGMYYEECIEGYYKLSLRDESDEDADFVNDSRFHTGMRNFLKGVFTPTRDETNTSTLLVHCVFGRSRSVAICMIILFLYHQHMGTSKTMIECYEDMGKKRKVIALNRRFLPELAKFEDEFHTNATFRDGWMEVFQ